MAAVPRLAAKLTSPGKFPIGKGVWDDDKLVLPPDAPGSWFNVFTGETANLSEEDSRLPLSAVFRSFPVALLVNEKRVVYPEVGISAK
jgi:maltooligosyltrehalose synthase